MEHLLQLSNLRHQAVPYDKIKGSDYIPALKKAMEMGNANIEKIKQIENPNFKNTIIALESCDNEVDYISGIYYGLYSAHCTDDIQKISDEFSDLSTKYYNNISLDLELFSKVKAVYELDEDLSVEEKRVLEKHYKSFVRNGALLNEEQKEAKQLILDNTITLLAGQAAYNLGVR